MTAFVAMPSGFVRTTRHFVRTPKGLLTAILVVTAMVAAWLEGIPLVLPGVLAATTAAVATDVGIVRAGRGEWTAPSGAVLSGLFVALVLSPHEHPIIAVAASVLAVSSKHLFRAGPANVFNPAALALVMTAVLFDAGQSWWGALPELGWAGVPVLLATGWFIADRTNKLPLVLAFLGVHFGLFTAAAFLVDARGVAEVFRAPDLHMALFFAVFMLADPPTCPVHYRDQVWFGALVAGASFVAFEAWGWLYFLLAGLLVGNVAWGGLRMMRSWQRLRRRAARASATGDRRGEDESRWRRPPAVP